MRFQQWERLREFQLFSTKIRLSSQFSSWWTALKVTATAGALPETWWTASISLNKEVNFIVSLGLSAWSVYPYTGALGACRVSTGTFKIVGYGAINDCNTLANALVSRPVSVAVDGNNFQLYKSGVFYNCATNLSLAVLLVGMTDAFWVLKNSWGTTWGESGYIRIARGNTCGVCQSASYPAAWSHLFWNSIIIHS